ncbi:MAG: exodeoxyribonuclease VII large subunit [Fibromonadaceae bacterium]|jgi:exodeoxyribonuclease VII large subunit|nr:exodeoxyribonuclease VII large subunit [Fibromonadaceae bacterium]
MMADSQGSYSLSNYLFSVQRLVRKQIPEVWVYGTVASLQEKGKMVYITLAEYEDDSVLPKASLSVVMFASQYAAFCRSWNELPVPFQIKKDLKIRVLLEADFYIPHGKFQCKILDIDTAFTLGEIAITRAKIWDRLVKEELHRLNGEHPMPLLPFNIGLITSENSAACNDFISTIRASGYAFSITIVPAKMQGQNTEADIIKALDKLRQCEDMDVVCIIRGGGAKTDLVFFDSYALCREAALFPLPVITGIGHEIDESLLDRVAHTHLITPTDCAKFLIERVDLAWQRLQTMSFEFENLMQIFAREYDKMSYKILMLSNICNRKFIQEKERLSRDTLGLKRGVPKIMDFQIQALRLLEEKAYAANPETQLKRGFTITKNENGKVLRSAKEATASTALRTVFADGETYSVVQRG